MDCVRAGKVETDIASILPQLFGCARSKDGQCDFFARRESTAAGALALVQEQREQSGEQMTLRNRFGGVWLRAVHQVELVDGVINRFSRQPVQDVSLHPWFSDKIE